MIDDRLRGLLRQAGGADGAPASFESVVAARRRRWRLRRLRAAVAAACVAALAAVALHPKPEPSPRLAALALPPTTDWLLETPRADWLTQDPRRMNKEKPDGA